MKEKIGIIAGGELDEGFLLPFIEKEAFDYIIAVDGALAFTHKHGIRIQCLVGDFDTIDQETLAQYIDRPELYVEQHVPQKDETDTELAMHIAMAREPKTIILLGGTGGRLDHFLGNLQVLLQPMKAGISCALADRWNRIQLHDHSFTLKKETQYGTYVSLIPWSCRVENLSLFGFQYPLSHVIMEQGNSLGISNEIREDEAQVCFDQGILICVESRDKKADNRNQCN